MDEQMWLHHEVRAIYEITRAINSSTNQQEVLQTILERLVTDLGYRAASMRLLDEERRTLELGAAYGLSDTYLKKGALDVTKSGIDRVVLAGQTATLADVRRDPGFQYPDAAAKEGLASMLAVPLAARDHVIGVLHVYTAEPRDFTAEEQAFIAAIANLGAQAIRRARLVEAFRRIAHEVNSSLALRDVLSTLLVELVRELNVKAGSIRLLGPRKQTLHLAAAYGLSETYLKKGAVLISSSPIDERALKDGKPVAITDLSQESGWQYPAEAQQEGIRGVLLIPLFSQKNPIGVLRLYSGQVRRFASEEMEFARAAGDLGAIAIENAKLHEALKERLETLQEDADGWYRFLGLS